MKTNCKPTLTVAILLLTAFLLSCYNNVPDNEPTADTNINENTPEITIVPTPSSTVTPKVKDISEYNNEAIFYCEYTYNWQMSNESLVFGCNLENVEMSITLDGHTYKKTSEANYVDVITIDKEHMNTLIKKMSVTLYEDNSIIKEYEYDNVLFCYTVDTPLYTLEDNCYNAEYLYIVSRNPKEDIYTISNMKNLKLLNIETYFIDSENLDIINSLPENLDLLKELPKLKHLYIKNCVPEDISAIGSMHNLVSLKLKDTRIKNSYGLEKLYNLEYFELNNYAGIDSSFLRKMLSLRILIIVGSHHLDNEFMNHISSLSKLNNLEVYNCNALTTIPDMSQTNLKSLSIVGCENLDDINGITDSDTLTHLELSGLPALQNIDCINRLKKPEKLKLYKLKNIAGISEFDKDNTLKECEITNCSFDPFIIAESYNLEELTLDFIGNLQEKKLSNTIKKLSISGSSEKDFDISEIIPTENLEELYIYGGKFIGLEELTKCANLKKLTLAQGGGILDLSCLSSIPTLEQLMIIYGQSYGLDAEAYVNDISFLESLVNLEYLRISISDEEDDYTPLTQLVNLKELSISSGNFYVPDSIGKLSNLERLHLRECYISQSDALNNLSQLKNVSTLIIGDCFGWKINDEYIDVDISFIGEMTGLESIRIWNGIPSYKIFPSLKKLTSLKDLSFRGINDNNIEGIWEAANLEILILAGWGSIDISGISNLKNLTSLYIWFDKIENYESILELKSLKYLHIRGNGVNSNIFKNIEGLTFIKD